MPAQPDIVKKIGYATWEYDWTDAGGTADYEVYENSRLAKLPDALTTYTTEGDDPDEPPVVEILDSTDTDDAITVQFPEYATLRWHGRANTSVYVVQRYIGSTWTDQTPVIAHTGIKDYTFETGTLVDGTAEQWRVVAEDLNGTESEVVSFTWTHRCCPAPPDIALSISAGTLTISADS